MIYTVVWLPSALGQLARIWTETHDRQAITAAADFIDVLLRRDPQSKSSGGPDARVVVVAPLIVDIVISDDDRLVTISAVWLADSIRNGR
jgi:hypothetical protein